MANDSGATIPLEPLVVDTVHAAKLLSVCPKTIGNLVRRGELPAIRIGRAVRFDVADLKELIGRMKQVG